MKASAPATRRAGEWAAGGALLLVLGYLVVLPLLILVVAAFRPHGFPFEPGVTFAHVTNAFLDPGLPRLISGTLTFAIGASALAVMLGLLLAFLLERTDMPWRGVWRAAVVLPMAMPPMLLGIAWTLLLGPRIGVFNVMLSEWTGVRGPFLNIYSLSGMIFVEGLALAPSAYLMLAAPVGNIGSAMQEAAAMSAAGPLRRWLKIDLPLLTPAIAACALVMFVAGLVVFDIPAIIGVPSKIIVLSTHIYGLAHNPPESLPRYGEIGALSFLFIGLLVGLVALYQRLGARAQRYVAITGRGWRSSPVPLRAWKYPAVAFVILYFLLTVAAPFAALLWTSLLPYQARISPDLIGLLTVSNHLAFFGNARAISATIHSLEVALLAASAVAVLAFLVAAYVNRSRGPGRRIIDLLAAAPLAIPGVMMGMALIFVYLTFDWLPVYGTIWIIVLAFAAEYLPFGSRAMNGVMSQLHPELEEAARMSGAAPSRVLRKILLPLFLPAAMAVWLWVFAHALRALSAPVMLQGRDNIVLSTLLWGYWNSGEPTIAAAIGIWLIVILTLATIGWRLASRRGGAAHV